MRTWCKQWMVLALAVAMLAGCGQVEEPVVDVVAEAEIPVTETVEQDAEPPIEAELIPELEDILEPGPEPEPEPEEEGYNPDYSYVALTFDDGPVANTDYLLDELAAHNVHATFFCLGIQATKYPETIQRIYDEGHQLANHSNTHLNMTKVSEETWQADFQTAEDKFNDILGLDQTYWLRPPYGIINKSQYSSVDVPMVMWSVDPRDWDLLDTQAVVDAVLATVEPNDIILLHDTHLTSIEAALMLIDQLEPQGYRFVTVEQLLEYQGIEAEPGVIYRSATGKASSIWYGS